MCKFNYGVVIPTYNAGEAFRQLLSLLLCVIEQERILIIDSSSIDSTVAISHELGVNVISIPKDEFNHGSTRNLGMNFFKNSADVVIYLTQDIEIASGLDVLSLLECFSNDKVGAAYGRQLPHTDANPIASHARFFNYNRDSYIRSYEHHAEFGLKTAFISNSFSAYRVSIFYSMGGFPSNVILAEDMCMAAKMLINGFYVAYSSLATVKHSHNYSPLDEFKRYFDIGVFHANETWIQDNFGGVSGEGFTFVKSEINYLWSSNNKCWIPRSLLTNCMKLIGYKLGKKYRTIPRVLHSKLGMYKSYWLQNQD
ncbi:glycosyltransferase [Aeromonas veronii]|uniref:glycosyltransferase n=1 Tax=Aeromonas veronii TaxID=654 RepID=UPI000B2D1B7C|nr:glycosyltransferase [Aeromonas veronii]MCJ8233323.1 glycosyltransferase [Aeromonas veronii]PSJ92038.1 rhamnosyltransferase [Aeromonas veronii]